MKKAANRKLSVNTQHDYLSLKTPVGTFTVSRSGSKCSGQLVSMPGAFEALDKYTQVESKKGRNYADIFKSLSDPNLMDTLVPGWDSPKVVVVAEGDMVKFTNPLYLKHYPDTYPVKKVKGKHAYLEVPEKRSESGKAIIGFATHELEKTK